MKKPTAANHSQHLEKEKVGTLTKGESVITIWREMDDIVLQLPDDCQYFVEENGELKPFDAFEETEDWLNPIPSILEEWIEKKMEEGYKLELGIEKIRYTDLEKVIAEKTLKEWYSHFLSYYEDEDGTFMLWVWFDRWEKARTALDISRDDFERYWAMLRWERDILVGLFKEALYDIWVYSNDVVYYAARALGKEKTWRYGKFTIKDAVRYIGRASRKVHMPPEGIVKRIIEKSQTEPPENEGWKKWLARQVYRNLYDAAYYEDSEDCEEDEE
jgi:hypothetical protein